MQCLFCNKDWKYLGNHAPYCKMNPDRIDRSGPSHPKWGISTGNQFTKAREKGLEYVVSEATREKLRESSKNIHWSAERRSKHSLRMRQAVLDFPESYSAKNVSGRAKLYQLHGLTFKGKWELKVAEALDREGIAFTNNVHPFTYNWENKDHLYFPDFFLPEYNIFLEVKGYKRERDIAKWAVVSNLIVFEKPQIKQLDNSTIKTILDEMLN